MTHTKIKDLLKVIYPEARYAWIIIAYAVFAGVLSLSTAAALQVFVNTVSWGSLIQPVFVIVILLLSVLLFSNLIEGLQFYVVEILLRRQFARLTKEFALTLPYLNADDKTYLPEVTNRYFEIVSLQKTFSIIFMDLITLAIQLFFGLLIIATYHPFFLLFDALLIIMVVLTLNYFYSRSLQQSIDQSKEKYRIASWLEDIARLPHLFRSNAGQHFSNSKANDLLGKYLQKRELYFQSIFIQHIAFLIIYSVMSASLLAIGGFLVVKGQLTLGQLVAGELILTMILTGLSKIGGKLDVLYSLLTSCDKILHLLHLPKTQSGTLPAPVADKSAKLELRNVCYRNNRVNFEIDALNTVILPGERILITGAAESGKSTITDLINNDVNPQSGFIELDGIDVRDYQINHLKQNILVLRGVDFFFGTVLEQITLYNPSASHQEIREILAGLGLLNSLSDREEALFTKVQPSGSPLSRGERIRLLLARGIVSKPRLLIIDELLDTLDPTNKEDCLKILVHRKNPWTLIVNSNTDTFKHLFDRTLYFEKGKLTHEFRT